jgi:hypothetical protein
VFAFDARESLVWLDPITSPGRGAGVLCARHADGLSPPRGWNLLDRRASEFRLWTGRLAPAAGSPGAVTHAPRRERPARLRPCVSPGPVLPFDAAPEPVSEAPRTWSPHNRPGPELEHLLDARSPMLARAFDAAKPSTDA